MLAAWVWKGLVCVEAIPAGKKKSGGVGEGRSHPPHLQTQCSQHGFGRDSYALKQTCPAKKKELKQKNGGGGGGGWGGAASFSISVFVSFLLSVFGSFFLSFLLLFLLFLYFIS